MGCVSTKAEAEDPTANSSAADKQLQQRRRLSVHPTHVGSDGGKEQEKTPPAAGKDETKFEGELPEGVDLTNLSEAGKQAAVKLPHAVHSRKGLVPYNAKKVNQDRAIIQFALKNDPTISLFGVMDGHGEYGHHVAAFVQAHLPVNLVAQPNIKEQPAKSILTAVKTTCDELAGTGINISFSGTTAVFGLKIDNKLYVANIGDSRCVLCRKVGEDKFEALPLSIDQKPENPKEKERILQAGGRVEPLPGPPGEDCGPPRVWLAEADIPGLAMSRSIGDEISQRVGVISVPEIVEHDIKNNDVMIVWASDGVWEFLSNENACDILWKQKDNLWKAASELVNEASKCWRREEEVIDDITCVIVGLNR
jgi:serine/threonine protein phosphatase PrpC